MLDSNLPAAVRATLFAAATASSLVGCTSRDAAASRAPLAASPAVAALSSESRAALARATVPLYLFGAAEGASTTVTSESGADGAWAAASYQGAGFSLFTQTTSSWTSLGEDEPPAVDVPRRTLRVDGRAVDALPLENEGIPSFTWDDGTYAFVLEVECEERDDVRCTDPSFLIDVAARLERVEAQSGGTR